MDEGTGSVLRLTGIVKNVKYPPCMGGGVPPSLSLCLAPVPWQSKAPGAMSGGCCCRLFYWACLVQKIAASAARIFTIRLCTATFEIPTVGANSRSVRPSTIPAKMILLVSPRPDTNRFSSARMMAACSVSSVAGMLSRRSSVSPSVVVVWLVALLSLWWW